MTETVPAAATEAVEPEIVTPGETIATEMPTVPSADTPEPEPTEPETPAAEAEPEPQPDKTPKPDKPPLDWKDKRRIEETNKRKAAEAERDRLKQELEALRAKAPAAEPTPSPSPAPAPITPEQAVELAKEQLTAEQRAREFAEATGRVLDKGIQSIPDFETARQEMVQNFGEQLNARPDFFEAIIDPDLPNGHDVFYALAKDPEQTERLLRMPSVKLGQEIAKLSAKLATPAAPEPAPISKAPPPVRPVGGNTQAAERLDDPNTPMDTWAKSFLKQVAGRGR